MSEQLRNETTRKTDVIKTIIPSPNKIYDLNENSYHSVEPVNITNFSYESFDDKFDLKNQIVPILKNWTILKKLNMIYNKILND